MTPDRPRTDGGPSMKARRRASDGAAGGDFAWPPPADDPDTCSIVILGDAAPRPRCRTILPADAPFDSFPDIDIETALDAFADVPAAPRALPTAPQDVVPPGPTERPGPAPWWHMAGMRGVVAVGIGASLALLPPPGLPPLEAARSRPAARPVAAPATAALAAAAPRRVRTPDGSAHPAAAPVSVAEPRPGRVAPRDEDRIRATLTALREAYAQLDAVAAREVWPSVDVDALSRAFDDLQSQELRFDHCDVVVDGARARAECTGEAIYVPRIADSLSSSVARAWTFELTRQRQRWTIASGRAS
jgi:hypothetical protein